MEAQTQIANGSRTVALRPFGAEITTRQLVVGALFVLLIAAAFLAAAGAAAKPGGALIRHHHPFSPGLRGVFAGLHLGLPRATFVVLLVVMTICYFGILALADSVPARLAVGAIIALDLIFALAPPLLSSDIFNYLGYARLDIKHHLNPYLHPLFNVPTDPTFPYISWPYNTTAYGPLFTIATFPLALIAFLPAIWVLKGVGLVASLGCVAMVWACAGRLGREPVRAALFFALNPLILVFGVAGAHNDFLMMLVALGGVYVLLSEREVGVVGLVASAAVKFSASILLPFSILGTRNRGRALVFAVGAGAVAALVSLAVFGPHVASLSAVLGKDASLATVNNVPGFLFNDVLGLGLSNKTMSHVGIAVFVPVLVALLVRVYRGADWLAAAGWATFAVLVTTTWFLPWYLVWWLPIAALVPSSNQRLVALGLTVLVLALQMQLIA